jgi:hypothetical protein
MAKLNPSVSAAIRQFSYWLANRSMGLPLLENLDYSCIFNEPSTLEKTYAIFVNLLEVDQDGRVTHAKAAEHQATQFIRSYIDPSYAVLPSFEDWEIALY